MPSRLADEKKISPGPWTSPFGDTIVDANGEVIGEVFRLADAAVMAASWKLLDVCMSLENDDGSIPKFLWDLRNEAIAEARVI
jgi:hypothetical protein